MISIRFSCAIARQPATGPGRMGRGAAPGDAPAFRDAESSGALTTSMASAGGAHAGAHASRLRRCRCQRLVQIRDQVVDVHEPRGRPKRA
jgi:hypothetical protein